MKTSILVASMLLAVLMTKAQDSASKKDTVPVYIMDKSDTVAVETLLYKGPNGTVLYCSPGYVILKGQVATMDGRQFEWVARPAIVGGLASDRKRKLDPIIQQ